MTTRNQSWQDDLKTYPEHFQKLIKAKVSEEDDTQEASGSFQSIIPPELWEPLPPPQIKIISYKDNSTGPMLLLCFGLVLTPIALVVLILASAVPGLLVAFAAGAACTFGLRISRSQS